MSIYRRTRKDKSGKVSRSARFTAEFTHRGQLHRRHGFVDRDQARHWIASETLRLRRGETGYVKPMLKAQVVPLIAEFAKHLRENGRDAMYCYVAELRLTRLAGECGWMTLGHVTRESLAEWQRRTSSYRGKTIGSRTKNQFTDIAVEWGKWLASPAVAKLPANPLAGIIRLQAKHNDAYRRAATEEELNNLLAACGPERRLAYLFRMYNPIRRITAQRLTWRMMNLDATPPFFKTPADINKSRREEKHTLRYDMAQELRAERKRTRAKADDPVFPKLPTLEDFKEDLKAAGVPFELGKDHRRLDFHALRRTLIRLAKRAGVSRDDAGLLLGHRDPRTTAKYYDEDSVDPDTAVAMEKLPTLGKVRRQA